MNRRFLKPFCRLTLAVIGAVALYLLSYPVALSVVLRLPSDRKTALMTLSRVYDPVPLNLKYPLLQLWADVDPQLKAALLPPNPPGRTR
jgi:hypothetical protein